MRNGLKRLLALPRRLHIKQIQVIVTLTIMFVTVFSVLIASLMLYNKFSSSAEENTYLNIGQIIEQVSSNLELYVGGTQDIFEILEKKIDESASLDDSLTRNQLATILETRADLVSAALFKPDGSLVLNVPAVGLRPNTELQEQSWFVTAQKNPGTLQFSPPHIQNLFKWQYRWVVSLSKQIVYNDHGQMKPGVLVLDVNFRTIDELSHRISLGKKGYIYIIDPQGNIVYHPQQQLIYAGLKYENLEPVLNYAYGSYEDESTGEKRIITIKTVNPTGWRVVGVSYADEIMTTKKDLSTFIFRFLIIAIALVLLISVVVSYKIAQPIRKLERSVKRIESGDFRTLVPVSGPYEVEQLFKRFNLMLRRIRELMDQIIHEQEAKRKSELDALQAQINPHFLYNTLNAMTRLAEMGRSDEVVTTITSLSKFFRISLSQGNNIIPLRDELEHVRHYLVIQKIRFKNKFEFEIEASEEALACSCLKLILQPLAENAVYHGIEVLAETGHIHIRAEVVDDRLVITLQDNGIGMTEEVLKGILNGEKRVKGSGSGVGVHNVHERIRLYYGPDYGLSYESELEEGTTVTITLPAVKLEGQSEG
ncbi:sensor histidine kinase [Paenibacillus physcomitrellae]|uniref:histidine kinase n=1 Tax=Paenibacillus physcomitrellae TaxID=1619311 RepID=A0ABQ1FQ18_9BACL|nr:sensor histidine kinase [Paenibacillus physcomitrellae]GGA23756.1 sensor histidine kinase [Paenibacillus physcomitrellae]